MLHALNALSSDVDSLDLAFKVLSHHSQRAQLVAKLVFDNDLAATVGRQRNFEADKLAGRSSRFFPC